MKLIASNRPGAAAEEALSEGRRGRTVAPLSCEFRTMGNEHRWGVVLAGGDGTRLQPLTRFICGDDRPKQFCSLFEGKTLLGQTLDRAARSIAVERTLVSLAGQHYRHYSQEPDLCAARRIVQPMNKGTAPPIVHSLLSIARLDDRALVAILPSDHHYTDEDAFTSALEAAYAAAAAQPDCVVLLGARPEYAEVEYGWIELGPELENSRGLHCVRAFLEKPKKKDAQELFEQGAVWNTFVMVGTAQAFLQMARATVPDLVDELGRGRLWAGDETHIEYSLYLRISTHGFSHDVLSAQASRLLVHRLDRAGWSDLGDPRRVASVIREAGQEPRWFGRWTLAKGPAGLAAARSSAIA